TSSLASRPAFLSALAMPRSRRSSAALSMSPPASSRARFTSVMPALVIARSSLTSSVVTAMVLPQPRSGVYPPGAALRAGASAGPCGPSVLYCLFLYCLFLHLGERLFVGRRGGLHDRALRLRDRRREGLALGVRGGARLHDLLDAAAHLDDQVGQAGGDELDRADRVVVARHDVVEDVGVGVGVGQPHDGDAELVRLLDRDRLLGGVDHEERVRQPRHVADPAEVALEAVHLLAEVDLLLLREAQDRLVLEHLLELLEAVDAGADRLEVRQQAAEPAL